MRSLLNRSPYIAFCEGFSESRFTFNLSTQFFFCEISMVLPKMLLEPHYYDPGAGGLIYLRSLLLSPYGQCIRFILNTVPSIRTVHKVQTKHCTVHTDSA